MGKSKATMKLRPTRRTERPAAKGSTPISRIGIWKRTSDSHEALPLCAGLPGQWLHTALPCLAVVRRVYAAGNRIGPVPARRNARFGHSANVARRRSGHSGTEMGGRHEILPGNG